MRIVPYEKFEIHTLKSRDQVIGILRLNTDGKRPGIFRQASDKCFWGSVFPNGFKLSPIITYRNSFLPVIVGRLEQDDGTVVDVRMRLNGFTTVFMSFWLLMCMAFIAIGTVAVAVSQGVASAMIVPFLMLIFGYGMMLYCFSHSARAAKEELFRILDVSNVRPAGTGRHEKSCT
jgi:hypothetical protein